jgi:(p)ppGpp synthase/HD superfamily hydrolase
MIAEKNLPKFAAEFSRAFAYAARIHATQRRKGTRIPYVSHLIAVAGLVLENGGGEDEAIAALLHDAAENFGGRKTLAQIHRKFGQKVARIVDGLPGDRRRTLEAIQRAPEGPALVPSGRNGSAQEGRFESSRRRARPRRRRARAADFGSPMNES